MAQERVDQATLPVITSPERLLLQEIETAVDEDRIAVAVDRVLELSIRDVDRVLPIGPPNYGFETLFPLSRYLQQRLLQWSLEKPEVIEQYRRRIDPLVRKEIEQLQPDSEPATTLHLAVKYLASSLGDELLWSYALQAIDRGWWDEAAANLRQIHRPLQAWTKPDEAAANAVSLSWPTILASMGRRTDHADTNPIDRLLAENHLPASPLLTLVDADVSLAQVAMASILVYRAKGESTPELEQLMVQLVGNRPVRVLGGELPFAEALQRLPPGDRRQAPSDQAFALEDRLSPLPLWFVNLPAEFNPARPVADPAFQVTDSPSNRLASIWRDKVIIHTGDAIRVWELDTGKPWPVAKQATPLWKYAGPVAELFAPLPLPQDARVYHSTQVFGDSLFFRFGPPVTSWPPALRTDAGTLSALGALDLSREGRLLEGFPWRPKLGEWAGLEIEGSPQVIGDRIFVGLTKREGIFTRSFVGCLDLAGRERWLSTCLAQARLTGASEGVRVSHARVCYDQGKLFYQASLGSLACLDAETGRILWLTTYPRAELNDSQYVRSRDAEARDLMEVKACGEFIYAMPADCDRVFALSRITGQPLWATPPGEAADARSILGISGPHLMVSGDRLYWLDRVTGAVQAAFPAGTSAHPQGARPSPRGVGRGILDGSKVYFPTREALWVFNAELDPDSSVPVACQRIDLKPLGLVGGNLLLHRNHLIMTTGNQVVAFETR